MFPSCLRTREFPLVIGTRMAGLLTSSNWGSFPAGREKCSAGACPQLGAGCGAQTTPGPSTNQCTQFSYLGVPAWAIGTKACPGLRSRDEWFRPPNSSFRRSKACPVPRYGAGNQRGRVAPTTFNDQVLFSYLSVPAPAGMGDSYDSRCPLASCWAKSFALAYKVLVWGVGIPSFSPNSTTTPTTLSNSIGRPASASWSIDVL